MKCRQGVTAVLWLFPLQAVSVMLVGILLPWDGPGGTRRDSRCRFGPQFLSSRPLRAGALRPSSKHICCSSITQKSQS